MLYTSHSGRHRVIGIISEPSFPSLLELQNKLKYPADPQVAVRAVRTGTTAVAQLGCFKN